MYFIWVGGSWELGAIERGEAAVPVKVGSERGQPDHPGRAGEVSLVVVLVCLPRAIWSSTTKLGGCLEG